MYTRGDAPDDGVCAIGARPGVVWCGCGGPYRCARAAPREGGTAREHRRSGKRVAGEFHGCCCARPARLQAQVPGKKRNYRQSFAAIWGSTQHLRPVEALGVFGFGVGGRAKTTKTGTSRWSGRPRVRGIHNRNPLSLARRPCLDVPPGPLFPARGCAWHSVCGPAGPASSTDAQTCHPNVWTARPSTRTVPYTHLTPPKNREV